MAGIFKRLFRAGGTPRVPSLPEGQRVYAIGDVHGRLDLLAPLAEAIEVDNAGRSDVHSTVIMLGDLVDRGPESSGVLDFVRKWSELRDIRFISGNHEEMFLRAFSEKSALRGFLRFGGIETLASYGLDAEPLLDMDFEEAKFKLNRAVPKADRDFMRAFEMSVHVGDYMFVHAGIHPKVPLDQQDEHDCRWIREPFLSHEGDLGCIVVHGHSVTRHPDMRDNRIGIDTGAYESGILTALCLEGTERRLIQASEKDTGIVIREIAADRVGELEVEMPGSL